MKHNAKKRKKRVKAKPEHEDIVYHYIDGKETECISARALICVGIIGWKDDGNLKCKELVRIYCRYISAHGYLGGEREAMSKLSLMDTQEGVEWVKSTFDKYVTDQMALCRAVAFYIATIKD